MNHYSYPVRHVLASHLIIVNCAPDLHSIPSLFLVVKNLPANAGDTSSIPGQEDPLEKEMATHSSVLAWRILWTEEPGRLQSMASKRVGHN